MSLEAVIWAIRQTNLQGNGYKILIRLADRHNIDTGICWPSVETIQKECQIDSLNTVRKYLKVLAEKGLISINSQFNKIGRQTSNTYYLHLNKGIQKTDDIPYQKLHPSPHQEMVGSPPQKMVDKPLNKNLIKLNNKKINKKRISEDAVLSDKQREIALSKNICEAEAQLHFNHFKDYCLANGKQYADWNAAWRQWLNSDFFKRKPQKISSISSTKIADKFLEDLKEKKIRA